MSFQNPSFKGFCFLGFLESSSICSLATSTFFAPDKFTTNGGDGSGFKAEECVCLAEHVVRILVVTPVHGGCVLQCFISCAKHVLKLWLSNLWLLLPLLFESKLLVRFMLEKFPSSQP